MAPFCLDRKEVIQVTNYAHFETTPALPESAPTRSEPADFGGGESTGVQML
jgi:hypothetical protein